MNIYIVNRFCITGYVLLASLTCNLFWASSSAQATEGTNITIKNAEMCLVIGSDGTARSLIHKAGEQKCLMEGVKLPVFAITQDRPYDNEILLAYPAKSKTFAADSIHRVGDDLIINFELTDHEATVGLKITDDYIAFTLKKLEYHRAAFGIKKKTWIYEC